MVRARAVRRAAVLAYGRQRASARVRAGRFAVHPGWRGRVPEAFEVVVEQTLALEGVRIALERELFSNRRHRSHLAMLQAMVWAMDWNTGLITGITREHLAQLGGCSTRTVSRMWAWAQQRGLLARVEEGATAAFLGTDRNRAAAFAFLAPAGTAAARAVPIAPDPQAVEETGNPPASCVSNKPLARPTLRSQPPELARWAAWRIPENPAQRRAAASEVLRRTGLNRHTIDNRRLHGVLLRWWDAGASPIGLIHMLDHHPDTPTVRRGPAFRGARDPLAVLGYRLAPWTNRLTDLPGHLHGRRGDYLAAQRERLNRLTAPSPHPEKTPLKLSSGERTTSTPRPHGPLGQAPAATQGPGSAQPGHDALRADTSSVRTAARAAITAHLATVAARRATPSRGQSSGAGRSTPRGRSGGCL